MSRPEISPAGAGFQLPFPLRGRYLSFQFGRGLMRTGDRPFRPPHAPTARHLLVLLAVACSCPALEAEKAVAGLDLDQTVQASVDPLGLQAVTRLYYRVPLSDRPGLLWESARIDAGILNSLSPSGFLPDAAPTLRAALGPFVVQDSFSLSWFHVDGGSRFFHERVADCALGTDGIELSNQLCLPLGCGCRKECGG